jgi:small-conductance mechanosensitive channel
MSFQEVLDYNFFSFGEFQLNLWKIILALIILLIARLIARMMVRITRRYFTRRKVDTGRQFAIQQILKYVIYTSAILMALEAVGIQLSLLWGGAAALLVGVGLGLQQTFNDLLSGIILLIEATIEVGDVIEVDGKIGTVRSIGIRTSEIETRDHISVIVPNSKLVGDIKTNWSHQPIPSRFHVSVGVAYSSDVDLVSSLLKKAASEHPDILKSPEPKVQFKDFGSSSLNFDLLFYSYEYMRIEFVKSDVRFRIIALFREHHVEIPFPQQDIWVRGGLDKG